MVGTRAIVMLSGRAVSGACGLAIIAVMVRALPPAEYGKVALAVFAVGLANAVAFQWLRQAALRFLAGETAERGDTLRTVLAAFAATLGIVGVVGAAAGALGSDAADGRLLAAGLVLLCAQAWMELALTVLAAFHWTALYAGTTAAKGLLSLLAVYVGGRSGLQAAGIVGATALGMIAAVLPATLQLWRRVRGARASRVAVADMWRYGAPLSIAVCLTVILGGGERVLISMFLGADAVARYAAPYDVVDQGLGLLIGVLGLVIQPAAVQHYEAEGGVSRAGSLLVWYASLAVPAVLFFCLAAGDIATLLLSPDVSGEARMLIPVVAVAVGILGLKAAYLDLSFQLTRRTWPQLVVAGIGAGVAMGLSAVLIPRFGLPGAAGATLTAYAVTATLAGVLGRRCLALPLYHPGLRDVACAGTTFALVMLATDASPTWGHAVGRAALASLAYGAVLIALPRSRAVVLQRGPVTAWRDEAQAA